jgi:periplasmic divalent cation tolerance protein
LEDNAFMDYAYLVITTFDGLDEAKQFAQLAIEEKVAACAQVCAPCESVYRWDGQIQKTVEYPVHLKTDDHHLNALHTFIKANHSYEVPEIITIKMSEIHPEYFAWLKASLG